MLLQLRWSWGEREIERERIKTMFISFATQYRELMIFDFIRCMLGKLGEKIHVIQESEIYKRTGF